MINNALEELHWFCSDSGHREAFVYYDGKEYHKDGRSRAWRVVFTIFTQQKIVRCTRKIRRGWRRTGNRSNLMRYVSKFTYDEYGYCLGCQRTEEEVTTSDRRRTTAGIECYDRRIQEQMTLQLNYTIRS